MKRHRAKDARVDSFPSCGATPTQVPRRIFETEHEREWVSLTEGTYYTSREQVVALLMGCSERVPRLGAHGPLRRLPPAVVQKIAAHALLPRFSPAFNVPAELSDSVSDEGRTVTTSEDQRHQIASISRRGHDIELPFRERITCGLQFFSVKMNCAWFGSGLRIHDVMLVFDDGDGHELNSEGDMTICKVQDRHVPQWDNEWDWDGPCVFRCLVDTERGTVGLWLNGIRGPIVQFESPPPAAGIKVVAFTADWLCGESTEWGITAENEQFAATMPNAACLHGELKVPSPLICQPGCGCPCDGRAYSCGPFHIATGL
jgi:hypothetical protein